MEDGSDLLTRIVRAELPAFTDLLLESLLNQEDLQKCRLAHWRWRALLDGRAARALERREAHHAEYWTTARGARRHRRRLDLAPALSEAYGPPSEMRKLVLDNFCYVGVAGKELFIHSGRWESHSIFVYSGSSLSGRLEIPPHSAFMRHYMRELDFDEDGAARQWVCRMVEKVKGYYFVVAYWGSRAEGYPFFYLLVFDGSTRAFVRALRHNLGWKRTTRPGDFLHRVGEEELWGYRGVKGNLELFRVEPAAKSLTKVGSEPLKLPRYTMSGTPLARTRISRNYLFYTYVEPDAKGIERKHSALLDLFSNRKHYVGCRGQGARTFLHFGDHHTACVSSEGRAAVAQIGVKDWRSGGEDFAVEYKVPEFVRSHRRGLDLGRVACRLSYGGADRSFLAVVCHYCDSARTEGFSVATVDLSGKSLSSVAHFEEGEAGQVAFAGRRVLLVVTRADYVENAKNLARNTVACNLFPL